MLALKYTLFAAISIFANLVFQFISFQIYDSYAALYLAMGLGTLAGLVTKYIPDKKWIFYHTAKDKADDAKKFILYAAVGAFITAIFWITEIAIAYLIPNPNA